MGRRWPGCGRARLAGAAVVGGSRAQACARQHQMSDDPLAVLGGGQLGRMLALAGIPLGLRFRFLDPVAGRAGRRGGRPRGRRPRRRCDASTRSRPGADRRHLRVGGRPRGAAARFARRACPVAPAPDALEVAQDRLAEKTTFAELGIPTAHVRARGDPRRPRARGRPRSGSPRPAQDPPRRLRRQGPGG